MAPNVLCTSTGENTLSPSGTLTRNFSITSLTLNIYEDCANILMLLWNQFTHPQKLQKFISDFDVHIICNVTTTSCFQISLFRSSVCVLCFCFDSNVCFDCFLSELSKKQLQAAIKDNCYNYSSEHKLENIICKLQDASFTYLHASHLCVLKAHTLPVASYWSWAKEDYELLISVREASQIDIFKRDVLSAYPSDLHLLLEKRSYPKMFDTW